MPLDIVLFRTDQGGNPDLVKESQRRRFVEGAEKQVDEVLEADKKLRKAKYEYDTAGQLKNTLAEQIKQKMLEGKKDEATDLVAQRKAAEERLEAAKKALAVAEEELEAKLRPIGNIVHASVPVSKDEADNALVKTWGECIKKEGLKHHHELLYMIDGYDSPRGSEVAGHRGYFLKGVGVKLNQALIAYGTDFLMKHGYTLLQTPFFMKKDVMSKTAQLSDFDEQLYKVVGGAKDEENEKYLIATSEQPISAFHMGETLDPKSLPLRYGGVSTCFRKEAGAYGKDTWGIFRVHQFEKIEQFCITAPEDSWEEHERMLKVAEEFYQSLNIPYRVVNIVSGELNSAAAKKYDLEGWFPGYQTYRELVSCSNCTDYQSRALEIRYGTKKQGSHEKKYVHMLNSTLCATTRTICAILENYQTEDGVKVPEALQPYMGGMTFMPFVHRTIPVAKGAKGKEKEQRKQEKAGGEKKDAKAKPQKQDGEAKKP